MEVTVAEDLALAPGAMVVAEGGGIQLLVIRSTDGTLSAVEDRCSHADVQLSEGTLNGGEIECPAHGARFDVKTGRALCLPAVRPVRTFPVKVVGGKIVVEIP